MTYDPNAAVTNQTLNEAVDAILGGMERMFEEQTKRFSSLEQRMDGVENRLERVETEVSFVKDEVRGLTAELSDTPSRKEFSNLTQRVEILENTN